MPGLNWKIDLAWIAEKMGLLPAMTVCECSVGPLDISIAPGFVGHCDRLLLIEPISYFADEAEKVLHSKVMRVAVGMESGKGILLDNNGSSYLDGTWAPTMTRTPRARHEVDIVTFDTLDDGQIDVLALDCEGQEWAVLSKMKSRPKLMTIEIWEGNPYIKEINDWLKENYYTVRFSTGPTSETNLYTLECTS